MIVYEGFFVNNNEEIQEILKLFRTESFNFETKHYHVTTEFKPQKLHDNLYGIPVKILLKKYKSGKLPYKESFSRNDGFEVEIITENKNLKEIIMSISKNWHLTGGFNNSANLTNYLDFSDGKEVSIIIDGYFSGFSTKTNTPIKKD